MRYPHRNTRRSFLKSAAAASAAATAATSALAADVQVLKPTVELPKAAGPNDRVRSGQPGERETG